MPGTTLTIAEIVGRENFDESPKIYQYFPFSKVYAIQYNKTGHHKSSELLLLFIKHTH